MTYDNTSKVLGKLYFGTGVEDVYINAIICQTCRSAVIIEYEIKLDQITLYDFDSYNANNKKILHVHSADERTRNIALEMFAAEKRLLYDAEPHDYYWKE